MTSLTRAETMAGWYRAAGSGSDTTGVTAGMMVAAIAALGIAAWWWNSALLLWSGLAPSLWLGFTRPHLLVAILLVMTPLFPVVRVTDDGIGAQSVSTKGLFVAADDPLVAAMFLVVAWRWLEGRQRPVTLAPGALAGLAALYPAVILLNLSRLEVSQTIVSLLYYAKWLEYAALVYLIPALVPRTSINRLVTAHWKALLIGTVASASYAAFETVEALRSGSYTSAALFPRASAFFGSLDPLRYGASEDPVNFGCYMILAGAVMLAYMQRVKGAKKSSLGVGAALLGALLSASRTPMIAALVAYSRVQKMRATQILLVAVVSLTAAIAASILMPEVWSVNVARFESVLAGESAAENSAIDRLRIALHSPVFEMDSYWLVGHGHSSYRFIAEQHLSKFTRGVSRSLYNFWLTVWYDAGPFGVLLWIVLFVQLNRVLSRIAGSGASSEVRALAWGLRGGLWGLLAASIFGEIPYNWRVMGFFYNSVGVCLAAAGWSFERRNLRNPLA